MSGERVIFGNTFEGLFRHALGADITPALRERLRTLGYDLDNASLPAYPHAVWVACVEAVGAALYPRLAPEQQQRALGRRTIEGYAQTMVGAAVLSMARLVGPMRSLARMTNNFRSSNNFTETRFTQLGPAEADVWFNEPQQSEGFVEGVLEEGLQRIGAEELRVGRTRHGPEAVTYHVRWKGPR